MSRYLHAFALLCALSGCMDDPETAPKDQGSRIETLIPNVADREGVFAFIPIYEGNAIGSFHLTWEPTKITEQETIRLASDICAHAGLGPVAIRKAVTGNRIARTHDDEIRDVQDAWFGCE